jgi:hypothetical protein
MLTRQIDHFLGLGNDSMFDSRLFTRLTARSPGFKGEEDGAAQGEP